SARCAIPAAVRRGRDPWWTRWPLLSSCRTPSTSSAVPVARPGRRSTPGADVSNPNEPSWDEIFRSRDDPPTRTVPSSPEPTVPGQSTVRATDPFAVAAAEAQRAQQRDIPSDDPPTRRELRERDGRRGRRRRRVWPWVLVILLALVGAGAATAWIMFEDRIRDVLGWAEPNDYVGDGNGTEIEVTIVSGQIGSDVAQTLV